MTPLETQLSRQLQECREALAAALRENQLLRQKVELLIKRIFGSSSEQIDRAQLELFLQEPSATPDLPFPPEPTAGPVGKKSSSGERAARLPENLPVVEEIIDPEPVKAAPEAWRCIGQEVSEQLDYEPARFLRRRLIRRRYVHRCEIDQPPIIAALPERLLDRGLAAPGLLAHLIVSKYCDHLPLYRQEQIFLRRHGVHLPRQTLARWMGLAAEWLRPIYEQIRTGVMAGGYVQVDETPVEYLEPGYGQTRQGYLWVGSAPGGDVFFRWETSRAMSCLENVVPVDFCGIIQCDGYSAYQGFADSRKGNIQLAGCWAHVRRKFFEALAESPRTAGWIMRQIQHLYGIEAELREGGAGAKLRATVRQHQSRSIVQRIHRALIALKLSRRHLPQSLVSKAIEYTLGLWPTLTLYLQQGQLEIDNNLVENAIRPTALGKKNWLFFGEADAGERGAILYTIVECCRRRGLDPYAYLRDVLTRLPSTTNHQVAQIIPAAWAKAQTPSLKAAS
jgi:transposase